MTVARAVARPVVRSVARGVLGAAVADFFVTIAGDDTNDGLSFGNGFATLSAAYAAALAKGGNCVIGVQRLPVGSTYQYRSAFLGQNLPNITIKDCGNGIRPKITAFDPVSEVWTDNGNGTHSVTVNFEHAIPGGGAFLQAIDPEADGNEYLKNCADVATVIATGGVGIGAVHFSTMAEGAASAVMTVRLSDDSNPAANGRTIEFTSRSACVAGDGGAVNYRLENIRLFGGTGQSGPLGLVSSGVHIFKSVVIQGGSYHSSVVNPGSNYQRVVWIAGYWGGIGSNCHTAFQGVGTGAENDAYFNCRFTRNHTGHGESWNGWFSHAAGATDFGVALFSNCYADGGANPVIARNNFLLTSIDGGVMRCQTGIDAAGANADSVVTATGVQFVTETSEFGASGGSSCVASVGGGTFRGTVNIINCTGLLQRVGGSRGFIFNGARGTLNIDGLKLRGDSADDYENYGITMSQGSPDSFLSMSNTHIDSTNSKPFGATISINWATADDVTITAMDNNHFTALTGNSWGFNGATYNTLAAWVAHWVGSGDFDGGSSQTDADASDAATVAATPSYLLAVAA